MCFCELESCTAIVGTGTDDGTGVYGTTDGGYAVYGKVKSNLGKGVYGENLNGNYGYLGSNVYGVKGYSGSGYGVYGESGTDKGVYGKQTTNGNSGYLGGTYAVYGLHNGGNYGYIGGSKNGILGYSVYSSGTGVSATASGTTGIGVSGSATGTSGIGVYGLVTQSNALSGKFIGGKGVEISGSLCVDDPADPFCYLDRSPDGYPDAGYILAYEISPIYVDLAELISSEDNLEPGDIVVVDADKNEQVRKSSKAYDTLVAGIVSTKPGIRMGREGTPIALAGRVPTKVSTENGPIKRGDLLTTSNTPGYAMRCSSPSACTGALVGKALEPLESGKGKIIVLVTLG